MILIGHQGAGKTTLGRQWAQERDLPFYDTDDLMGDLFHRVPLTEYRLAESRAVQSFCPEGECIIATGGGVILDPLNVVHLRQFGPLVYLHREPEALRSHPRFNLATYRRRLPIYRAIADEIATPGELYG